MEQQANDLLVLVRRTAQLVRRDACDAPRRVTLCKKLLRLDQADIRLEPLVRQLSGMATDVRHYWIGTFYALLLAADERRSKATYFTPPYLARSVVALACENGFDLRKHTAIDPAAGGAAFLSILAAKMRDSGLSAPAILNQLCGIELDPGLAILSETLIADQLETKIKKRAIVAIGNSLKRRSAKRFDLVLANPPYGRITLGATYKSQWKDVCHPGHINKYALFTKLCFRLVKRNGLIGLVLPSSFVAGPLYDKLRAFLREHAEILVLGSVAYRNDVFIDVDQDISVVILRAGQAHRVTTPVAFGTFERGQTFKAKTAAVLPIEPKEPWVIPASVSGTVVGRATLDDYGVTVRAGYFVWNREKQRMFTRRRRKLDIPLIWAKNVRAGKLCSPKAKKRARGIDYVHFEEESSAIVRKSALVMQRTTNSSQDRRLIVARVDPFVVQKWGGFVSENHTIVISGDDAATINALCVLLNSKAVDDRYRQLSGTASISVTLLRQLDLPSLQSLTTALARNRNIEQAIEQAYSASASELVSVGA